MRESGTALFQLTRPTGVRLTIGNSVMDIYRGKPDIWADVGPTIADSDGSCACISGACTEANDRDDEARYSCDRSGKKKYGFVTTVKAGTSSYACILDAYEHGASSEEELAQLISICRSITPASP